MLKVQYTGEVPLVDHPTGPWKPDEVKEMGDACADALVRERGDMAIYTSDKPRATKKKPKEDEAGGDAK